MNCETFRDRLFDYLAGRPVDREAFAAHRAGCAPCAALLLGVSENEAVLRGARVPTAPAHLWPAIAARISARRRPRWIPWSAAAAALLAIGLALFAFASGPRATLDVAIVDASPEAGRAFTALVPRYEDVDPGLALADTMFRFED